MRDTQLNLRLSPDERERFDRVAEHYGVNMANMIRMLVKREEAAISAAAPPVMSGPASPSLVAGAARSRAKKRK